MAIFPPRMVSMSSSVSAQMSRPSKLMLPRSKRPGGRGMSCMVLIAVTLLPQPDSPTTASVCCGKSVMCTPFTAWMRGPPLELSKLTARSATSRTGRERRSASPIARIASTVAGSFDAFTADGLISVPPSGASGRWHRASLRRAGCS